MECIGRQSPFVRSNPHSAADYRERERSAVTVQGTVDVYSLAGVRGRRERSAVTVQESVDVYSLAGARGRTATFRQPCEKQRNTAFDFLCGRRYNGIAGKNIQQEAWNECKNEL